MNTCVVYAPRGFSCRTSRTFALDQVTWFLAGSHHSYQQHSTTTTSTPQPALYVYRHRHAGTDFGSTVDTRVYGDTAGSELTLTKCGGGGGCERATIRRRLRWRPSTRVSRRGFGDSRPGPEAHCRSSHRGCRQVPARPGPNSKGTQNQTCCSTA